MRLASFKYTGTLIASACMLAFLLCKHSNAQAAAMAPVVESGKLYFTKEVFEAAAEEHEQEIAVAEFSAYGFQNFPQAPDVSASSSAYHIAYQLKFSACGDSITTLVIAQQGSINKAWLVSYSSNSTYIDSRLIYCDGELAEDDGLEHEIYTEIDLDEGMLSIYNESALFGETQTPLKVHGNGKLEAHPEDSYEQSDFAEGYMRKGMYGKYGLGEAWTAISFSEKAVATVKTVLHGTDDLNGAVTIFDKEAESHIKLCAKGAYSINDIAFYTCDTLSTVGEQIEKQVRQVNVVYEDGEVEKGAITVMSIHEYKHVQGLYYFVKCSIPYNAYDSDNTRELLVGVHNGKAKILVMPCFYEHAMNIFSLKGRVYVYTGGGACGEGAYWVPHVYLLNSGFEEKFSAFIQGD